LIVRDMLLTGFDAPVCQVMYLDRKLIDHGLLQAIARVNRTASEKTHGFIVDYYGLSDYLSEALEIFSTEDLTGALEEFKDEFPKLQAAHTVVMGHFSDVDLDDLDACILSIQDETRRQEFSFKYKRFSRLLDTVLPHPAAAPYLSDLRLLGKIMHGARNLFRDDQLDVSGSGEKVRKLIEEHIYATGVDPKIPPVELFSKDFKKRLRERVSDQAKASEIEHAIKHHIAVKAEEDPVYYEQLSERLKKIIENYEGKWEELVQLLLDLRDNAEDERKESAQALDLSTTEKAFYNVLMAEITKSQDSDSIPEDQHEKILSLVRTLVGMIEESSQIVDFFNRQSEVAKVEKKIRRAILDEPFGTTELVKAITAQFMRLAEVNFK